MKLLSVGLNGTTDEIRARLQKDCVTLSQEGFCVAIDEINKGSYTFLGCNIIEGELSFRNYERIKNLLKHYVAQILAETIVLQEEKTLIHKIIERNYNYLNEEERGIVYDNTFKMLKNNNGLFAGFSCNERREQILSKLLEYLDNHHELVVEGFINFRLKDYKEQLIQVVDKAVDDLMMELEYKEFIRVLRYFVEVQEPKVEEVHVVMSNSGTFKILDSVGKTINNQYLENFATQSADEINYEDLLITALITIAPYNVMLHCANPAKARDVMETIKNIFDGRVVICPGCDICNAEYLGGYIPK